MRDLLEKAILTSYIDKEITSSPLYHSNLLVNDHNRGMKILKDLQNEMRNSRKMFFSVAFITESGLAVLANELLYAQEHKIPIYLLTSDYLYFNDSKVFEKLLQFPNIQTRVIENRALHNKAYIFDREEYINTIIGSANLTANALTKNQEWSVKFSSLDKAQITASVMEEFLILWNDAQILTKAWIENYKKQEKTMIGKRKESSTIPKEQIIPNKMQSQALRNIDQLRKEGKNKALLISSTGTGKTYLSAFDVRNFNPKKMLFVIHREQIARDAMNSYRRIMPDKNYGFLSGRQRDYNADYLFTTIQTLSRTKHLQHFSRTHFDYIVIDEAHHSEASSYQKIIEYFKPNFLLGMTATPERTDGKDIYQYFDHNIAYEIRLQEALEEEMLCPFHYYGVTDITVDNKYIDDKSDFNSLTHKERIKHIIKYIRFYGYSGNRLKGLMFVSRNDEAESLSYALNQNGFKTLALSGKNSAREREDAIRRLTDDNGDLDYIITVDIFNEGIDIPEINQIVMLRPTQSAIVFVQQLGRGLRKNKEKDFLVVIDFIGNYENNFLIPIALSGDSSYNKENLKRFLIEGNNTIPGSSTIHFDEISQKRIYNAITQSNFSKIKFLKEKHSELKSKLGYVPLLKDYLKYESIDPQLIFKHPYFNNYYDFLLYLQSEFLENYSQKLSKREQQTLSWLSLEFSNGKRKDELIILKELINNKQVRAEDYFKNQQHKNNLLSIFSFNFYVKSDQRKYGKKPIVKYKNNHFFFIEEIQDSIQNNKLFKILLEDVIDYGIMRHQKYYQKKIVHNDLVLFEQYSKKDVCRLLLWEKDEKGTMYGYRFKHNTFPIFVTYHKSDDIAQSIQYDDKFIDQKFFSWMSKNNRTMKSKEIIELKRAMDEKIPVDLFIKKDDEEENQFFYVGPMSPVHFQETSIQNDKGKKLPIVNVIFEFQQKVQKDLYDYFTKN